MESKRFIIRWLAGLMVVVLCMGVDAVAGSGVSAQSEVVVFAAASTTNAVTEIGKLYADRHLGLVTPSFASSSTLAET